MPDSLRSLILRIRVESLIQLQTEVVIVEIANKK